MIVFAIFSLIMIGLCINVIVDARSPMFIKVVFTLCLVMNAATLGRIVYTLCEGVPC